LSSLSNSGAAILKTLAKGMLGVLSLPGKILGVALKGMLSAVRWVWQGIKSLGSGILSTLTRPFQKGVELAASAWRGVTGVVASAWNGIKGLGASAFDAVATPFRWIGDVAGSVWDGIRSTASELWSGVGNLAQSAWSFVSAPFTWIADAASNAWSHITNAASMAWDGLRSMSQSAWEWIKAPFEGLASVASSAWEKVKNAASGAWDSVTSTVSNLAGTAFESGKAILTTVGEGIKSAVTAPYRAAKSALSFVRDLLPFSDAKEGPLANLTRSGSALLEALAGGIAKAATVPAKAIAGAFGFMNDMVGRVAAPSMLAGTLALTPVVAGEIPSAGTSLFGTEPAIMETRSETAPPEQSRLLGETRGVLGAGNNGFAQSSTGENLLPVLEAMLSKFDALAERPIDVSVTTLLDGRQVAQSVYRDLRERKIKNYETL
jgi:phage-related protein